MPIFYTINNNNEIPLQPAHNNFSDMSQNTNGANAWFERRREDMTSKYRSG